MAPRNPYKTFVYRGPGDWKTAPDGTPSEWIFRGAKIEADDTAIREMSRKTILAPVNIKEMRRLYKKGVDIEEKLMETVSEETVMSLRAAELAHMSIGWSGPEMALPEDFPADPNEPNGLRHEFAGKVPPCTAEYIQLWDPDDLDEVLRACHQFWSGRTQEEQDSFPGGHEDALGPEGEPGREGALATA